MAEGFAKQWLAEQKLDDQYTVESRSLSKDFEPIGSPPSAHGQELMHGIYGIDISACRSQLLSIDDVRNAKYLIGVSKSHVNSVRNALPREDLGGLLALNKDISDPWHADRGTYEECAVMIRAAVASTLSEIFKV
jgi:protein-tyrosine-phosphatase